MNRKKIEAAARKFHKQMRQIVDDPKGGITSVSMTVAGKKIVIAKRRPKK